MKKQPATAFAVILIGVSAATMTVVTSVGAQPGPPCTGTNHCVDVTLAGGEIPSVANVVVLGTNRYSIAPTRTARMAPACAPMSTRSAESTPPVARSFPTRGPSIDSTGG